MYLLLFFLLVGAGIALARAGYVKGRAGWLWGGGALAVGTLVLFPLLGFWAEALWFHAVGFGGRFWTFVGARLLMAVLAALAAGVVAWLLLRPARRLLPALSPWAALAAGAGGLLWGLGTWQAWLLFLNRAEAGVAEPILGLDAGFYLFTLPVLQALHGLLQWLLVVLAVATGVAVLLRLRGGAGGSSAGSTTGPDTTALVPPVAVLSATAGVWLGLGALLGAFGLLYSELGVTAGPGWTDANIRLPVYLLLAVLSPLLALVPAIRPLRRWLGDRLEGLGRQLAGGASQWLNDGLPARAGGLLVSIAVPWGAVAGLWLLLAGVLPAAVQGLVVEPNEITFERPYIANNIALTRHAFGLDEVEQRQYPLSGDFDRQTVQDNQHLISEVRLWDWRALDAVYKQFQEIRLYYEFVDVDMDRYRFDDRYREVMVSARELSQENLAEQSQTFVNRRFKYTHGYGLTLATVSDFTPEGLPNLLVKDIPPESAYPSLAVERPEIYYGELTKEWVVANSSEQEFDYPKGEQNAYTRYAGQGGVELKNLWRKFLFGWKLDSTRLLLSSYPRPQSRIMLHRQIEDRVRTLAPFLELDDDPYLVLVDGRLKWIIDAYTTSTRFPYSEPFVAPFASRLPVGAGGDADGSPQVDYLSGNNYVRNSVKVVVDAYQGSVNFYVFEPEDPLISAWQGALPGMFQPRAAMPEALEAHVRYPEGLLLTQGLVYAKYHMNDPEVFYNQEDLWVRATEKHYDRVQPVEPYYVMWELPESDQAEFVLMLPFTPKNRQVLIGWIAGLSDGDNYGRFLAYQFPKERRVLGPQQVETKIDQDSHLSGQLTLWDQRGSNVIRGNVLAIPLDHTLLYVEPIYLQAETAAYPELRLVAVMHGDDLSYAETFDEALAGLFGPEQPTAAGLGTRSLRQLAGDANAAFQRYLGAQGEGRFRDAADALTELQSLLSELAATQETGDEQVPGGPARAESGP
ncbi:hypothetical protein CKO31_21905 [Thiohalocapsa halophila]|uniref:UPF0182 protein CKO31_21905 n=1 Tax=Thiohalocapsa halophila TaxID=69359 RepID=A0ABS1CNU6_9GAMM|nr:UPF0182 family protein [Thiohalocapsa halophila]MBK1633358.1 hypothetical protein [Thiohalocapsa halophila]